MEQVIGRTTRRRAIPAALAAALVAVSVLAVGAFGHAQAASGPPAHVSAPHTHFVTQTLALGTAVYGGKAWSWYQPARVESWIAADGSGREETVSAKPRFASQEDRETWEAAGSPRFLAQGFRPDRSAQDLPPGSFDDVLYSPELSARMPPAGDALSSWLRDLADGPTRGGGNGFEDSVKTIELMPQLLRNPTVTAAQRAALFDAATAVSGVEVLGAAEDAVGREGIAIAAESANSGVQTRYSLIIDPESGRALESEALRLAPLPFQHEWIGPQLESRTTYMQEGRVGTGWPKKRRAGRAHAHRQ